jgi:hypothetical protein
VLFSIGPAMQAMKKPTRREAGRNALQKLPSATLLGPGRQADGGELQVNPMGSAGTLASISIDDTDSVLKVSIAGHPSNGEGSVTPDFFIPTTQEFVALPLSTSNSFCAEDFDHLLSMGPSEPTWSPTAFWHTACSTSWDESPWGLRPDAWVIPAVSTSEGMQ